MGVANCFVLQVCFLKEELPVKRVATCGSIWAIFKTIFGTCTQSLCVPACTQVA